MTKELIGMILSVMGMLVTVASFQIKGKKLLLLFQTIGTCFYLVSYVFSGGGIAIALNVIYLFRNGIYMALDGRKGKAAYLVCGGLCAAYLLSYVGFWFIVNDTTAFKLWNLLPIVGALFGTYACTHENVNRYRLWKLGDSGAWLAFNIYIGLGALGGIIGEILGITSIVIGIIRFYRSEEKDEKV